MKRSSFIKSALMLGSIGITGIPAVKPVPKWNGVWKEEDIKGGMYITYKGNYVNEHNLLDVYHITLKICLAANRRFCFVMMDGYMCMPHYTKRDLVNELNRGYQPTTKEEMHAIIDHTSKNFL